MSFIINSFVDFFHGLYDSLQIFAVFPIIYKSPKNTNNIFNCFIFNGLVFLGSMLIYFKLVEPIIISSLSYYSLLSLLNVINYFYYIFWLIPLFIACNILTGFWIDEIYVESLTIIEGSCPVIEGQNFLTALSNNFQRILIVIGFILQNTLLNLIPIPGIYILKWISLSILNSLYVFEYIILQKYVCDYKSILIFVESKFFYFLGYGCLLTVLLSLIQSVTINTIIFLMIYPFFLVASLKVNNYRFKNITGLTKDNKIIFLFFISSVYTIIKDLVLDLNNMYFGDKNTNKKEEESDIIDDRGKEN